MMLTASRHSPNMSPGSPSNDPDDRAKDCWMNNGENVRRALQEKVATGKTSLRLSEDLSASGLLDRINAVRNCVANAYAPHTVWWPVFGESYMELDLHEQVSQQIFMHGSTEVDLLDFFVNALSDGMTFLDIGAHIGFFSIAGSHLVGPTGSVHSFEPTPLTAQRLALNLQNAGATNAHVHRKALWNEETELEFKDFGPALSAYNSLFGLRIGGEEDRVPEAVHVVTATTLDAFCDAFDVKPDIIKLDVESAEFQVLQGGHRTLTSARPVIAVEVGDFAGNLGSSPGSSSILEHLMSYSYEMFENGPRGLTPHVVKTDAYSYSNIIGIPAEKVQGLHDRLALR